MSPDSSSTTEDNAAVAKRRRLYTKVATFAIILLIAFLKPRVEAWLAARTAGAPQSTDVVTSSGDSDQKGDIFGSGDIDLGTLTINDENDQTIVTKRGSTGDLEAASELGTTTPESFQTVDPSAPSSARPSTKSTSSESKVAKSTDTKKADSKKTTVADSRPKQDVKVAASSKAKKSSPLPRMAQPPPLGTSGKAVTKDARNNPTRDSSSSTITTEKNANNNGPAPGVLVLVKGTRDEFRSTAGLMYVRGSEDGHRLKHVLKHAQDNLSKPVHGVFDGTRDEILAWIDRAYIKGRKGGKGTRVEDQGGRTVFTVDLGEKIGFVGGQVGKRKGHPACRYLRLVIQNGSDVVTAYPSQSL